MPSRRTSLVVVAALALALALAACSGRSPSSNAAAEGEVRAATAGYVASLTVGPDSTASFFTDSGTMLGAGMPPVIGRAAIVAWLAPLFKAYEVKDAGGVVQAIDVTGDVATVWGTYHQYAGKRGEDPASYNGRYVAMWKRGADRRWRMALMMTQADPQPTMPPAKPPAVKQN